MLTLYIAKQHRVFFGIAVGPWVLGRSLSSPISRCGVEPKARGGKREHRDQQHRTFSHLVQTTFPWILILALMLAVSVTVGYGILLWLDPPNW